MHPLDRPSYKAAALILSLTVGLRSATAGAQGTLRGSLPVSLTVGSDVENYLRYLQTIDSIVPLHPWSIRGFTATELDRLSPREAAHPWANRFRNRPAERVARIEQAPTEFGTWYNSAFPYGNNDGAVWRGRGATWAAHGGVSGAWGPLSVTIAPILFYAENRAFELMPTGGSGDLVYADPAKPRNVDRPQRFGDAAYSRLDPGQTSVEVDLGPFVGGVSTANMWWGPMSEYPYLLGNNAPGFPHMFAGSSAPWNVGIGRVHGRLIYGKLEQSNVAIDTGLAAHRFASGLVAVFSPRGARGLEIGGGRFFHTPAREGGPTRRDFMMPIQVFFKSRVKGDGSIPGSTQDRDNQLASAFFRWVLPRSRFEVYGEFGREDHNGDARDLVQEPDHESSYGLGVRRAWRLGESLLGVTAELMNMDPSILGRVRPEIGPYVHYAMLQGHTHRGQLLGAGFGTRWGGASLVSADLYAPDGSRSALTLKREVLRDALDSLAQGADQDVQYSVGFERKRLARGWDLGWELVAIYELNRNLRSDAFGIGAGLSISRW